MNILVTDTSTAALTVALKTDRFFETRTLDGLSIQHSERLMCIVNELCSDAGISTRELDLLACTRGPGSFTGLRIGMAALKGMAYALDKPLVSVSTLETLASCIPYFDGAIVTALDAKKQRWYLGAFENKAGSLKRLLPDTDGTQADLYEVLGPYDKVLVTGPDAKAFSEILKQSFPEKTFFADEYSYKSISSALVKKAVEKLETCGPDDIGQGPVYLRKSDAEVALEERLKAKAEGNA